MTEFTMEQIVASGIDLLSFNWGDWTYDVNRDQITVRPGSPVQTYLLLKLSDNPVE